MTRELVGLGFVVLPSSANFVFARHPARGGTELAASIAGSRRCWSGISTSPARRTICASPSGQRMIRDGLLRRQRKS